MSSQTPEPPDEWFDWYMPEQELTDQEREYLAHLAEPDDLTQRGVYDQMVHRATDGSDPLVQEPKGKP
jgi:hypothetical protein